MTSTHVLQSIARWTGRPLADVIADDAAFVPDPAEVAAAADLLASIRAAGPQWPSDDEPDDEWTPDFELCWTSDLAPDDPRRLAQEHPAVTLTIPDDDIAARRRDSLTDADLTVRFAADELAGQFCWSSGLGWLRWDARRWARCSEEAVAEACRSYFVRLNDSEGRRVYAEARAAGRALSADEQRYLTELNRRLAAPQLAAVVRLSRGVVGVESAHFDAHPDLLNAGNGVVDLRTGDLRPHDPALLLTRVTLTNYRQSAEHPDWDALCEAFADEDVREWFQIRAGQASTGHTPPDDVMPVCHGPGSNGKSAVLGALQRALGEHAITLSDRVLLASDSAHPTERMELRGARLALIEELPGGRELNVNRLKKVVGTPTIEARHIAKDSVTFDASHALFVTTNDRPIVRATDHGSWRRLALVTFPWRFRKPHEPLETANDRRGDSNLRARALNDPAVQEAALAWLVDGARYWYESGREMPEPPARVVADTEVWRRETDLVLGFVSDVLVFDRNAHVISTELHSEFTRWLGSAGHRAWTANVFKAAFIEHSTVTAAHVTTGRTRSTDGLSRPADGLVHPPVSGPVTATFGVRFKRIGEGEHLALVPSTGDPLASEWGGSGHG